LEVGQSVAARLGEPVPPLAGHGRLRDQPGRAELPEQAVEVALTQVVGAQEVADGQRAALVEFEQQAQRPVVTDGGQDRSRRRRDGAGGGFERRLVDELEVVVRDVSLLAGFGVTDAAGISGLFDQQQSRSGVVADGSHRPPVGRRDG
jgi:hypothetical protein